MLLPTFGVPECSGAVACRNQRRLHRDGVGDGAQCKRAWRLYAAAGAVTDAKYQFSSGQDGGFFTTVSSNAFANPIIWAVSRPVDASGAVTLYAFDANDDGIARPPLQAVTAGVWPYVRADANIVPVVANGRVHVASYQELAIFGIGGTAATSTLLAQTATQSTAIRRRPRWPNH
jgi:hypothetical protein